MVWDSFQKNPEEKKITPRVQYATGKSEQAPRLQKESKPKESNCGAGGPTRRSKKAGEKLKKKIEGVGPRARKKKQRGERNTEERETSAFSFAFPCSAHSLTHPSLNKRIQKKIPPTFF